MVFDRRESESTEESEEEPRRTKPRVSSRSGFRISSGNVGRVRRMDVIERRRTSCIFGNNVLRTVYTSLLGVVDVLGFKLFLESEEVVVMKSEGRNSSNVLQRVGGGVEDESEENAFGLEQDKALVEADIGVKIP